MTFYELSLFVHVSSVIVWLGSGFCMHTLGFLAERARDTEGVRRLLGYGKSLSNRVFAPSSSLAVLGGVALVIDGPSGFGDLWVLIGIAGVVGSGILVGLFGKAMERVEALVERDGAMADEGFEAARGFFMLGRIDVVLLFVVVAAMTLKPSAEDAALLAAMAAALLAGVVWAVRVAGSRATVPASPARGTP